MFTDQDLKSLQEKEISVEKANWQIEQFVNGVKPINLVMPATPEKGVVILDDINHHLKVYDEAEVEVVKFIPSSGAASRMFKDLFEFRDVLLKNPAVNLSDFPAVNKFFSNIKKFAFYNELNKKLEKDDGVERLINGKKYEKILTTLLTSEGLGYGDLPKGLLSFHFYAGGVARTPFEEHLREGAKYAVSAKNKVKLHFTVSPEHINGFKALVDNVVGRYQEMYSVVYDISFSIQKPSTDTVAVTSENTPFYADNEIVFRPGGHGALIENLNEIDADIIFIKNIDNVVPEKRIANTIKYKKALAGYLFETQQEVFKTIKKLSEEPTEEDIQDAKNMLERTFNLSVDCLDNNDEDRIVEQVIGLLNRPIRVCGVVKNLGEPGGGPFLVQSEKGCISPQIVESSQVDLTNESQKNIFSNSSHFNPVDLVCGVRNYKGEKFNLSNYVDKSTCFISNKTKDGKKLKALELPGLWNGAMAFWNTIFIEVSVDTFNPVKSVNDLLRDSHQ